MRNRRRSGRLAALLAATILCVTATWLVSAPASATNATGSTAATDSATVLSCPQGHTRPGDTFGQFIGSGVNIRTGPGTDCTSLGHGQIGQPATYHCWVVGHDGRTWTHLSTAGVSGWVRDDFLSGNGSPFHC